MRTITLDQAIDNLESIIQKTISDHEETIIASKDGSVVVIDENEWSNIKETLRLLSDKESLAALLDSHAVRDRGEKPEALSAEEVFGDV
jgi:PHD/YefM family antitoxin component YafN of YafNO toxin-antitoxin module